MRVLLVAATGSDARGPAQALLQRCSDDGLARHQQLTVVSAPQLRVEHALDLTRSDLTIFLTEDASLPAPLAFRRLTPPAAHSITSDDDALGAADVMHTLATLGRHDRMPACFSLTLGRADGADPAAAQTLVDGAFALLAELLDDADPQHWDRRVT